MANSCSWVGDLPIYQDYHDTEWGVPEYDGRVLWEKLVLDGFQAGLSWLTILKKRDAFREAFAGFDPYKVADFTEEDVLRLLSNPGIVRHRGKIEAAIKGARAWQKIEADEGFSAFCWKYVGGRPIQNNYASQSQVPTSNKTSTQFSEDLKKAGFTFCGPTIVYAWMEATGMYNNHVTGCHRHHAVKQMA